MNKTSDHKCDYDGCDDPAFRELYNDEVREYVCNKHYMAYALVRQLPPKLRAKLEVNHER